MPTIEVMSDIEAMYQLAVLDFNAAHDKEMRWEAQRTMSRLERLAAEKFGFDFRDELRKKMIPQLNL